LVTVTNGRESDVLGAVIWPLCAQAVAPRGRRQKCSVVGPPSSFNHAM
jgi:hypothetical protein